MKLRLISALVAAFLVGPAFAGFAAAAACAGDDAMPCCAHEATAASVTSGCCRIDQAPAPMRGPVPASRTDSWSISIAPAPVALLVAAVIARPAPSASRGPTGPGVPLYLAHSAIRR